MAFREFDGALLTRRSLLRSGGLLGAGAAFAGTPFGHMALAQSGQWPAVTKMTTDFVDARKVANMVAVLGWGQRDPEVIARGRLALGGEAVAGYDSLYRIYSMTKPVTGMATMMLIDDGKLGLDQPLAEILPAFVDMRVLESPAGSLDDTVPAERPITIRNLLTHTAGLGYDINARGPLKAAYARNGIVSGRLSKLPIPGLPNVTPAPGLEAWADRLAKLPLQYQPGTKWHYSFALDLLGRVIEVVSGMEFDVFLSERIFKPAGMDSTWMQVPQSEVGRLTTNYGILNGLPLPLDPAQASIYLDPPPVKQGGSDLVSSPRDYDRFLRMLAGYGTIDGKRVMSEVAVRVGTSNILPEGVSTDGTFAHGVGFGAGGRVGLGEQAGTFGWGGAAGTVAFVDMKRGLRASLYTQYVPSEAYPVHADFPKAVAADLAAMAG